MNAPSDHAPAPTVANAVEAWLRDVRAVAAHAPTSELAKSAARLETALRAPDDEAAPLAAAIESFADTLSDLSQLVSARMDELSQEAFRERDDERSRVSALVLSSADTVGCALAASLVVRGLALLEALAQPQPPKAEAPAAASMN